MPAAREAGSIEQLTTGRFFRTSNRLAVTTSNLPNLRLLAQKTDGSLTSARDVVAHMGAIRGHHYYDDLWSIGLRTGQTEKQVIGAIENLEIIRTWTHRGTIHFVLPEDALWMVNLSAKRLIADAKRSRKNLLRLSEATFDRAKEVFAHELEGGKRLTRSAMMNRLKIAGISPWGGYGPWGEYGAQLLQYAAQTGLIYIGPMEGKEPTFGLLADLPVPPRVLSHEEAVAELTRRYFRSRGPATIRDFVWWSGLTDAEARAGLSGARAVLEAVKIDDQEYWFDANLSLDSTAPEMLLLSKYDEFLVGYKDRSAQVVEKDFNRLVVHREFFPSIVRNGQVAGVWSRRYKYGKFEFYATPFRSFTMRDVDNIGALAWKLGRFFNLEPKVFIQRTTKRY